MSRIETGIGVLPKIITVAVLAFAGCKNDKQPINPRVDSAPPVSAAAFEPTPTAIVPHSPTPEPLPTPTPEIKPPRFIERGNPNRPEIALTLDGGAGSTHSAAILDVLAEKGVKATMFLTGKWMEQNPNLVRRMVEEGHQIANHSWDHTDFRELSDDQIRQQLQKTEAKALELTGVSTKPYFRPPYGGYDRRVVSIVTQEGYTQFVYWTYDSGDWIDDLPPTRVQANIVSKAQNGAIVVMHLNSWQEPRTLGQTIDILRQRGLQPVTLSEILKD